MGGPIELTDVNTLIDPVPDITNVSLFPQHLADPSIRVGGESLIPIENKHMPLKMIMPLKNESIEKYSKIKELWFFCAAWTINPDNAEWEIEHMMSFTSSDVGAIETAFTESRASIGDKWLLEAAALQPESQASGDMNDDDDTPSF